MIIDPNNSVNNITGALPHGYKIRDDNVWLHIRLLHLHHPLPHRHVAPLATGGVQVGEWMEQDCFPVRSENALGDEENARIPDS